MPILDPPRAGFTNSGNPRSVTDTGNGSPARTTTYGGTTRPAADSSCFMWCLSIDAADANTPDPT
jgi:hypothetical protein